MAEKKHSTLALLEILTTNTDEDHILTTRQLLDLLKTQYDLDIERRTLYSNLAILEQAGYKISRYEDNGKGYFLEEKQFDKGEILLLCNAIHASHYISDKQSTLLIKKLLKTLSKYEANEFKGNVYMPNPQKTLNSELMYNISLISEAIRDHKMIQFTYNRYNNQKQMVPRREEPYLVEPRYIVYADSRPYLIATNKKYYNFTHYRIDRINKAFLIDEAVKPLPKEIDAYEYAKNKLFMYGDDMEPVTFLCDNRIMDHMIDLFGPDVLIAPQNEESFMLRTTTSKTGALFLAQQFLDSIQIMEPKELRKEFKKRLETTLKQYQSK